MSEQKVNNIKIVNEPKDKNTLIRTLQTINITNMSGVQTQAEMLITGVDNKGNLQWKRPYPYIDCGTCGYGQLGCDYLGGFIQ